MNAMKQILEMTIYQKCQTALEISVTLILQRFFSPSSFAYYVLARKGDDVGHEKARARLFIIIPCDKLSEWLKR